MKLDEEVKMISAEAPLLFAKACEIFIHELTLRAWLHTDDNKRRTLQRNDIAMAISKYDQFDFLIDIVPRDEIKPKKESEPTKASSSSEPISYFSQISGGDQAVAAALSQPLQALQAANPMLGTPMLIPIQTGQGEVKFGAATLPHLQQLGIMGQQQMPQQIILQQVMSPNGEITQIPVRLQANLNLYIFSLKNVCLLRC